MALVDACGVERSRTYVESILSHLEGKLSRVEGKLSRTAHLGGGKVALELGGDAVRQAGLLRRDALRKGPC